MNIEPNSNKEMVVVVIIMALIMAVIFGAVSFVLPPETSEATFGELGGADL